MFTLAYVYFTCSSSMEQDKYLYMHFTYLIDIKQIKYAYVYLMCNKINVVRELNNKNYKSKHNDIDLMF